MLRGSSSLLLFSFWILLATVNCRDKRNPIKFTGELDVIVRSFQRECSRRSINVETSPKSLLVGFGRIDSKAGSCRPNSYPKIITIDSLMWKALSAQQKEALVYHELAHCLLNRKHNNDVLDFGECRSWMRESDSRCSINLLNKVWREYYLNELFKTESPARPSWYNTREQIASDDSLRTVDGKLVLTKSNALLFDSHYFQNRHDWMLKIHFPAANQINGSIGIAINEYSIEFASYSNLLPNSYSVLSRVITLNQFRYHSDKNILVRDTLESIQKKSELFIKKKGKAIFIFFENDLKLCIPIAESKMKISGYYAFKDKNACLIRVFEL